MCRSYFNLFNCRSGDQTVSFVSEPCHDEECMLYCIGHSSQSQSTTMMNIIGNPLVSWSQYSEDDSGFETSSAISDFFPRRSGFSFHNRHKATHTERNSQKLVRGKIQKRSSIAPYLPARSIIRRKSIQELRLPPILSNRGLLKYTRAFQKGNCIYIGKAATMAMDGDFG